MKMLRTVAGCLLIISSIVFAILPGSILFLLAGLVCLAYDYAFANHFLRRTQKGMTKGAAKLDKWLLARKHR